MRQRTNPLHVTAVAGTAMVVLAACGSAGTSDGSAESPTPAEFMDRIVAASIDEGSVHVVMDMGAAGGLEADMVLGEDDADMALDMTADLEGDETKIVLVEEKWYIHTADLGDQWIISDPDDPNDPFGEAISEMGSLNPAAQVEDIKPAVTGVEKIGEEKLGGVDTTHYEVTVDPEKAPEDAGFDPEILEKADLEDGLVFDYWLDADDLMRKVSFDIAGQSVETTMTGWGETYEIEAPKNAVTFAELMQAPA
ncbi:hypothetical protein ABT304_21375 [Nocardioides sp. NPDC000445]|uniref:hypothetical protein n=1 Tax=Nocardioides sp. NPDC000445 TaxID=3154257 RepID=UPI003320E402